MSGRGKKRRVDDISDLTRDPTEDCDVCVVVDNSATVEYGEFEQEPEPEPEHEADEEEEEEEEEEELQAQRIPSFSISSEDERDAKDPIDPRVKEAIDDALSKIDSQWDSISPFESTADLEDKCRRMDVDRAVEMSLLKSHVKRLERDFEKTAYGEDEREKGDAAELMMTFENVGSLEGAVDRIATRREISVWPNREFKRQFDDDERSRSIDKLLVRRDAKKRIRLLELDSALDSLGARDHRVDPNNLLDCSPIAHPRRGRCTESECEIQDLEEWYRFVEEMRKKLLFKGGSPPLPPHTHTRPFRVVFFPSLSFFTVPHFFTFFLQFPQGLQEDQERRPRPSRSPKDRSVRGSRSFRTIFNPRPSSLRWRRERRRSQTVQEARAREAESHRG